MEGEGKISRYVGTLLFLAAMTFMIGFWWARTTNAPTSVGLFMMKGLTYTIYVMVVAAGYMAAVGTYHTFLAVMGWDGEPGLLSDGERSGPLSGGPEGEEEAAPQAPVVETKSA